MLLLAVLESVTVAVLAVLNFYPPWKGGASFFWHPFCFCLAFAFQNLAASKRQVGFWPHMIFSLSSSGLMVFGGYEIYSSRTNGHFTTLHGQIGLAAWLVYASHIFFAQMFLYPGFLKAILSSRGIRIFFHRNAARALLLLNSVNIIIGFSKLNMGITSSLTAAAFHVVIVLTALTAITGIGSSSSRTKSSSTSSTASPKRKSPKD